MPDLSPFFLHWVFGYVVTYMLLHPVARFDMFGIGGGWSAESWQLFNKHWKMTYPAIFVGLVDLILKLSHLSAPDG